MAKISPLGWTIFIIAALFLALTLLLFNLNSNITAQQTNLQVKLDSLKQLNLQITQQLNTSKSNKILGSLMLDLFDLLNKTTTQEKHPDNPMLFLSCDQLDSNQINHKILYVMQNPEYRSANKVITDELSPLITNYSFDSLIVVDLPMNSSTQPILDELYRYYNYSHSNENPVTVQELDQTTTVPNQITIDNTKLKQLLLSHLQSPQLNSLFLIYTFTLQEEQSKTLIGALELD